MNLINQCFKNEEIETAVKHRLKSHPLGDLGVKMARKLRLQNRIELVDFCAGSFAGIGGCAIDGELAKLAGSFEKPG